MKSIVYCLSFLAQLSLFLAGPPIDKSLIWDSPYLNEKTKALSAFIATGITHLSIKQLDPVVDSLQIDEDGFKFDMQNMHVQGMRNMVIDNVSIDEISRVIRVLFHTDFLLNSNYITSGSLFSLPIYGEGDVRMRLDDVLIHMEIPFDIIKDSHGREIIDLKSFQYTYDVRGGAHYYLDNLYYGDKHSSDVMHQLLQQNWKLLSRQYGRYLFDKVNDKLFNSLRNYFCSNTLSTIILY